MFLFCMPWHWYRLLIEFDQKQSSSEHKKIYDKFIKNYHISTNNSYDNKTELIIRSIHLMTEEGFQKELQDIKLLFYTDTNDVFSSLKPPTL